MRKSSAFVSIALVAMCLTACYPYATRVEDGYGGRAGNIYNNRTVVLRDNNNNVIVDGDYTFTSDIVNRYSLNDINVVKKGMTYDELVTSAGFDPYFYDTGEGIVVNHKIDGTGYYFNNGKVMKVVFRNGKVEKIIY